MKRRRLLCGAPATLLALARRTAWPASVALARRAAWPAGVALAATLSSRNAAAAKKAKATADTALRVGVDPAAALLARALLRGFGRYSGLPVRLEIAPSSSVLEALERGELDAALTLAPEAERKLVTQGLAHDRRPLGQLELLLVGPTDGALPRGRDAIDALRRIAEAEARFVGRQDGSGLHLIEQSLWRAAGIAPAAPWYASVSTSPLAQARETRAYVLLERAGWRAGSPREKYGIVVEGDARLEAPLHVLRSFRSPHAAARLFVDWIAGPAGQRIVAAQPGVRAAGARPQ